MSNTTTEKKRELANYGGIILQCPLELMYFKREPAGILYRFSLWLAIDSFEQDLPPYSMKELEGISLQGDEFTAFQASTGSLLTTVDAKIAEICEIDLSTRHLEAYEINAQLKIIDATAPKKSGGLVDNPKILNRGDDAAFDEVMQKNTALMMQVGSACLQYAAGRNSTGFFAQVLSIVSSQGAGE